MRSYAYLHRYTQICDRGGTMCLPLGQIGLRLGNLSILLLADIYNGGSLHIVKLSVTWLPVQRNELFSFYMIYQQEAIIWLRLYSYKTHLLALDCVFFCLWDPDAYYPWIQIQLLPLKQMAGPKIWNSLPRNVRNVKNRGNEHFRRSTKRFFLQKCLVSQKNDSWIPGATDLISGRAHREQLFL